MSAERTAALLVRLYPAAWRARYGDELAALILEASGGRVAWRTRLDVARSAARERLRAGGLAGDRPPAERILGGTLAVLAAWALFVPSGVAVQKFSEHWQDATPAQSRGLPAGAFDALAAAAALGTVLVVLGAALALPAAVRFLRDGGAAHVRRRLRAALGTTAAAVPLTIALVAVAHGLDARARNGGDLGYVGLGAAWAAAALACLAAWTALGVAIARRISLSAATLRLEALLGGGAAGAMVAMTAATAVWWAALARSAPRFIAGAPSGVRNPSPLAPALLGAQACMLLAAAAAAAGAWHALRALRRAAG